VSDVGVTTAPVGWVYVVVPVVMMYSGNTALYLYPSDDAVLLSRNGSRALPDMPGMILYRLPDGSWNPLWLPTMAPGDSLIGAFVFLVRLGEAPGAQLVVGATTTHPVAIDLQL